MKRLSSKPLRKCGMVMRDRANVSRPQYIISQTAMLNESAHAGDDRAAALREVAIARSRSPHDLMLVLFINKKVLDDGDIAHGLPPNNRVQQSLALSPRLVCSRHREHYDSRTDHDILICSPRSPHTRRSSCTKHTHHS